MKNIEFQIYDFIEEDIENYIIHCFGRTLDGDSVYSKITGYTPHFYIELPSNWKNKSEIKKKIQIMISWLKSAKQLYYVKNGLIDIDVVKRKKAEGFNNNQEFYFARLIFNNNNSMKRFTYFFDKNELHIPMVTNTPTKFKMYESNLMSMLRCFHIRKISGCAWVSTTEYELINEDEKISRCKIEINVDWLKLNPINKDVNAPLIIAAFDIECFSHDGQFPQATREKDEIIQIGMTYTILGSSIPYRKWIACLDNTDPIEGVDVISCETERDVIEAWIEEVNTYDCDILTGYNIFYFDEKYIYDRCVNILNMKYDIGYISKLKNRNCNFKEMTLASSALGENLIRIWDTPGRIHIDLMKDIQKTFNLPMYKLDFIASNFIRGEVVNIEKIDINKYKLSCLSIDDIQLHDYIHLDFIKGFVSDEIGEKYLVIDIDKENKKFIINSTFDLINIDNSYKIFWSQAKDDVGPKDIFRMQKEGPVERAIVAKYCIKDCSLVGLLVNKLEVVTKNLEMSNVCYVPMSYLFTRGQGIKLFSLCLKEYKEHGYLFPVIKVKRGEDGEIEKTESYEGAIVFDPVAKIDYEAVSTKDYMSLYPASIIHKNMSHETIVEDNTFNNIEGITYYDANYKENDGTIKYVRFAKVENKLGVIPSILSNLLKERKAVKKLMGKEQNPFKYKILDAKQLALKTTANSLYGQLGASTSPVAKRDIAACTTSTGREMLLLAKKYDEEILPWLINGLKNANEETFNKLLDFELKARTDIELIDKLKKYTKETIKDITLQPVVRYGDSVIGETPILLKHIKTNNIIIKLIKDLNNFQNYEVWTEKGWTKILNLIKHKFVGKLFRITTNSGSVVVTNQHSLLDINSNKVIPTDLKIGDKLLHSFTNDFRDLNYYDCNDMYQLGKIVTDKIPYSIYNNQYKNEFLKGFLESNKMDINNIRIDINNSLFAMSIYTLLKSVCVNVSLNITNTHYIMCACEEENNNIINIEEYTNNQEFVYDLTTLNHHFHAGVGSIIVHNTDSAFTCFRFRENTELVDETTSLILFKEIINFGLELIKPLLKENIQEQLSILYNQYYSNITKLELPKGPECMNYDINIIFPLEERLKIFLKEYIEYNYFSWLWTLQEIVQQNYDNINIKLFDWANYLLTKYKIEFNELTDKRKEEVIKPILEKIDNHFLGSWVQVNDIFINELVILLENTFQDEIKVTNLKKLTKDFLHIKLKENWIGAIEIHDVKATIEKKKLKRERLYNNKELSDLIVIFIETNLKLNFNKYKTDHINKIKNFVNNTLKDNWIQPYWDVVDGEKSFKVKFYKNGSSIIDKRTLEYSIELGVLSGETVKSRLPFPHDLEYEKTFWPFLILSKKRYVGNKYEFNPNKFKQDFMGIVLKRRDNAPIVKEICSGIIDKLINDRDPIGAKNFIINCLNNMFLGKYDIKYFLQSRTLKLKESYKDWTKIGHVFLSEKIAQRDPGNKPQSGDRIEFAVINPPEGKKHVLQGEMIEVPSYIKQHNIPINYSFYMKNQIMNPVLQFLLLVDKNAEQIFIDIENKYKFKSISTEPKDIEEIVKKVKVKKVKELKEVEEVIKKTSKKIMKKKNIEINI